MPRQYILHQCYGNGMSYQVKLRVGIFIPRYMLSKEGGGGGGGRAEGMRRGTAKEQTTQRLLHKSEIHIILKD